jgi:hypothetical protein
VIFRVDIRVPLTLTKNIFIAQIMLNPLMQSLLLAVIIFLLGKEIIDIERRNSG